MTECDHKEFTEIVLDNKPLKDCELFWSDGFDNTRLYVSRFDPERGFRAHAVEFVSSDNIKDHWSHDSLIVSTIFEVTAYWDGMRHLEVNRNGDCDMNGYLYYQSLSTLITLLEKVRELEMACCREPS